MKRLVTLTTVFLLGIVNVAVLCESLCPLPPSLWCSSPEVARLCKVEQQCKDYLFQKLKYPNPVNFTLYFESNCPDCKRFFSTQLWKAYNEIGNIMNITLVPYGNAHEKKAVTGKWEFTCQHGRDECVGNLIETCAIHLIKNSTEVFTFIHCIESDRFGAPADSAKKCAKKLRINEFPNILSCASSEQGMLWEHEMALQTEALKPPHQYVPWVTVNGVHTEELEKEAETDLLSLICKTYTGQKPKACMQEIVHHSLSQF